MTSASVFVEVIAYDAQSLRVPYGLAMQCAFRNPEVRATQLLQRMSEESVTPNVVCFSSAICACAKVGTSDPGVWATQVAWCVCVCVSMFFLYRCSSALGVLECFRLFSIILSNKKAGLGGGDV